MEPNNATALHNRGSLHERNGRWVCAPCGVHECYIAVSHGKGNAVLLLHIWLYSCCGSCLPNCRRNSKLGLKPDYAEAGGMPLHPMNFCWCDNVFSPVLSRTLSRTVTMYALCHPHRHYMRDEL